MIDLKILNSVLGELEKERGISREKTLEAIEHALATAYRKEYGKKGQVVRALFNPSTGTAEFQQVKVVVAPEQILPDEEDRTDEQDLRVRLNPEHHLLIDDARKIKKDAAVGDEMVFSLETKEDFGRIAAQTAKQMIIQKIREAEKEYLSDEFGKREGEIVSGTVQRVERGSIFVDLGRATGILSVEDQIPGERYRQGERIAAYLYRVEETARGVFLRLSRSHPLLLKKLFEREAPEVANEVVELKAIAREAGSRSKIAVFSHDPHVDPVGSCVGQRGVRVSTVMSELGGEKIDLIEWSEDPATFIEEALSPAKVLAVQIIDLPNRYAVVRVAPDQQSLAIGKGGQNVRLAHKLTGWKIDIQSDTIDIEPGTENQESNNTTVEEKIGSTESITAETTETQSKIVAEEPKSEEPVS